MPKRPINEQDKINFAKGKKFSKDNQPSPEAKSRGHQKKKTMREMLDYLLSKEITNKNGEKATTLEAVMVATIKKALTGDTRATEFIRDTIGQKPIEKVEATNATITVTDEKTIESVMNKLKDL